MALHHHRPHLSQRTLAIVIVVIAPKPLPANPPSCHNTFYALYGTVQLVVYSSDHLRGEQSVLDHLSATVFTSGELG